MASKSIPRAISARKSIVVTVHPDGNPREMWWNYTTKINGKVYTCAYVRGTRASVLRDAYKEAMYVLEQGYIEITEQGYMEVAV